MAEVVPDAVAMAKVLCTEVEVEDGLFLTPLTWTEDIVVQSMLYDARQVAVAEDMSEIAKQLVVGNVIVMATIRFSLKKKVDNKYINVFANLGEVFARVRDEKGFADKISKWHDKYSASFTLSTAEKKV